MQKLVYSLVAATLLMTSKSFGAHIIFDIHGVLLKRNHFNTFLQIGPLNFVGAFNPFNRSKIEETLFDFLDLVTPRLPSTPQAQHQGRVLPQIICDWLAGIKTQEEIQSLLQAGFKEHASFFSKRGYKRLIKATTRTMFDPLCMAKSIEPLSAGIELFEKLRAAHDEHGNPLHKLYLFSNWDAYSFELILENKNIGPVLSRADGIVISGNVGKIKPDPLFFEHLFEYCTIDPDHELTVYIDDEPTNIIAAKALGRKKLHPFLCKERSFKTLKGQLRKLGIAW